MQCNKNTCSKGVKTYNKRLQKGRVLEDKSIRVMHYANNMHKEVGIIAHSCGVKEPRELRAYHARIVGGAVGSRSLEALYA